MGNCLVTKLKGVVDSDELLAIGEMEIVLTGTGIKKIIMHSHHVDYNVDVTIKGDGFFTDESGNSNLGKKKVGQDFYVKGSGRLIVKDKYSLRYFYADSPDVHVNVNDFAYNSGTWLSFVNSNGSSSCNAFGDVTNLALKWTNLQLGASKSLCGSLDKTVREFADEIIEVQFLHDGLTLDLSSLAGTKKIKNTQFVYLYWRCSKFW